MSHDHDPTGSEETRHSDLMILKLPQVILDFLKILPIGNLSNFANACEQLQHLCLISFNKPIIEYLGWRLAALENGEYHRKGTARIGDRPFHSLPQVNIYINQLQALFPSSHGTQEIFPFAAFRGPDA